MNNQILQAVRCNNVLVETSWCINTCKLFKTIDEITNQVLCDKEEKKNKMLPNILKDKNIEFGGKII